MKQDDLTPSEPKYIELQYSADTQAYLRAYCEANGFDLSVKFDKTTQDPAEFDFHSTVIFSSTSHSIPNRTYTAFIPATAKNFALFGENKNILVIEIDSPELVKIHDYFMKKYNIQEQFEIYRPHVTLCYNYSGDLPQVSLPDQQLVGDVIRIKRQKP